MKIEKVVVKAVSVSVDETDTLLLRSDPFTNGGKYSLWIDPSGNTSLPPVRLSGLAEHQLACLAHQLKKVLSSSEVDASSAGWESKV